MPPSVVDDLVLQVNGGVAVEDEPAAGRFTGKTVIVTGAASGIWSATASRVAREGGAVVAVNISAKRLDELKTSLSKTKIVTVMGDITTQDAIVAAAGDTIDALAYVAGVNDDFSSPCTRPPMPCGTGCSPST